MSSPTALSQIYSAVNFICEPLWLNMLPKESHRKGEDSHMSGFVCAVMIVGQAPEKRADSNLSYTSSAKINKYNKITNNNINKKEKKRVIISINTH